ncbi:MAG: L-rhamnose isomerase [Kiritimatiellia bacterium]|nr:L-rhamnose isomerase [Kiritimatiellia bacterium]
MPTRTSAPVESRAYRSARKAYAAIGVDTEKALRAARSKPISLHCWQADDVTGFEVRNAPVDGGGILATGQSPGRARNGDEIRQDLECALSLLPGAHRVNVHALYAETDGKAVDRDALTPAHFARWTAWARKNRLGLDFNTSFFAHPNVRDGMTLSHPDPAVRRFWLRHGIACRRIAAAIGKTLRNPCVLNHWLPDGAKDSPADRWTPRTRLTRSLDEMLAPKWKVDRRWCLDAVEGKLFGIGSEEYVVGSNEYYSRYSLSRGILLCMDMGHFHPTETIHDKLSAILSFQDRALVHLSRPVRWDSDHVTLWNDDLQQVFLELVRGQALDRAFLALDFFDASINRVAAYGIGARAARKALLFALLQPVRLLQDLEAQGRHAEKLAWMEEMKTFPFGGVWEELCRRDGVAPGPEWMETVRQHEASVLSGRT